MKLNAKYTVFTMIAVASIYVLYHNERFLVDSSHPVWQHYEPFKWWLLPHGIFGAIVLAVRAVPVFRSAATAIYQSASRDGTNVCAWRIRARAARRLHTVLPGAVWSAAFLHRSGNSGCRSCLIGATAFAGLFAYKRKIALHRQWATRSYAIALVFIAGRFVLGVTGWETLGVEIVAGNHLVLPRAVSCVGRCCHPLERNSCGGNGAG